ncbi:hypothetical protein [Nitrosomonas sp. Nm166]|uniref:hypothetical protein n=1 Tax=Nitrosomonas sp. Nm166 TaxID=1881054 RepID=UPI0008E1150B|nr:hypothetical protein [Nitrosomonas sp. Nm166]SFE63622.1 hypothetical protein SAMN05428977_102325 [Nitrosomonas sp. Nm166]
MIASSASAKPYIRPIVRGKQDKTAEFGARISVSLTGEGLAMLISFTEVPNMKVMTFKDKLKHTKRYGYYPEVVIADTLYGLLATAALSGAQ